jgi:macrolide-specific efflux system membrane fusion protein
VDNRDGKLFSEMTVQVDIETGEAKGVLTMPMVSLGERAKDGRFAVTRLGKEGKQELVLVRTGLQDGAKVEVREGLKVGDKVLLAPPSAASAPAEAASSAASRASS